MHCSGAGHTAMTRTEKTLQCRCMLGEGEGRQHVSHEEAEPFLRMKCAVHVGEKVRCVANLVQMLLEGSLVLRGPAVIMRNCLGQRGQGQGTWESANPRQQSALHISGAENKPLRLEESAECQKPSWRRKPWVGWVVFLGAGLLGEVICFDGSGLHL